MKITVVITSWQVPFSQVVNEVVEFGGNDAVAEATAYINNASAVWWQEVNAAADTEASYDRIAELGYDTARYEAFGGEVGFHAMLDAASSATLLEAHYKREYDDKGMKRPGYMRVAMGEDCSAEIAEVHAFYASKKH